MKSITKSLLTLAIVLGVLLLLLGCAGSKQAKVSVTPEGETTELPAETPNTQSLLDTPQMAPADTVVAPQKEWGWIKNDWINVREQPNTSSAIVSRLQRGSKVELLDHVKDWWEVQLEDGTTAYIHESLIHHDPYIDPWVNFKMNCRLADTSMKVIGGVSKIEDASAPSAKLLVTDGWYLLPPEQQKLTAQQAFLFWQKCLEQAGYDSDGSKLIFTDEDGRELARSTRSKSGALDIKLADY